VHLLVKNCCSLKWSGREILYEFSVASRNTLLRFPALFVPTFGDVTPMVDNLREMFGRHDVAGLGDCYNEVLRILLPRTPVNRLRGVSLSASHSTLLRTHSVMSLLRLVYAVRSRSGMSSEQHEDGDDH
jgi:hypothetical protein